MRWLVGLVAILVHVETTPRDGWRAAARDEQQPRRYRARRARLHRNS
ncbi:MAG TPA: hypothetical protein VGM39_06785 [Kofleriaceae bacterium]